MSFLHWGPHFPDSAQPNVKHWHQHFPDDGQAQAYFPGFGPGGLATLAMDLEDGFTVTLDWTTDVIKSRGGQEPQRICAGDDAPQQSFKGAMTMIGADPRGWRSRLARLAAVGAPFLLRLPHEAMTLVADASGQNVFVTPTAVARCDWALIGQRVVLSVAAADGTVTATNAVIQSVTGGTIGLDVAPGAAGAAGGTIAPAFSVYLDPQQSFARYAVTAERWDLTAIASVYDFSPPRASLDLGTVHVAWSGFRLVSRVAGLGGNQITFELDPFSSNPVGGVLAETFPTNTTAQMKGGTDTLSTMASLINSLSNCVVVQGSYAGSTVIGTGDGFTANLGGGSAESLVGTGATLTTYASKPVWDRGIFVRDVATDALQAMTEIVSLGGKPYALGVADVEDWGRALLFPGQLGTLDWQWIKLFLWTARGRQKSFWVPTWRADMTFVSKSTNTITVSTTDGSDPLAWFPSRRQHVQILQANSTITRAQVTSAVDNGNGTMTLTIGTTISGVAVTMVSWLELCRFESDRFEIPFKDARFTFASDARVVQA